VVERSDTTGHDDEKSSAPRMACQHVLGSTTAMPSTYLSPHYHIVFATKNREPSIDAKWRVRLYEYLGGTIAGLGGVSERVGGTADHVHLLISLKATHCLADVMRELKKAASVWVHEELGLASFAWQEGYGAFTVSATSCDAVIRYIDNPDEHHRVKSFREEFIEMLEKAGIEFDPKYLE
jgi:putative transposase